VIFREQRIGSARSARALRWSILAQTIWLLNDRRRAADIASCEVAVKKLSETEMSAAARGPGPEGADVPDMLAAMAAFWARCSRQLDAVCRAHGIRYFHFLQPNQYDPGSKPMSAAERQLAWLPLSVYRVGIEVGYPLLERRFPELEANGVRFGDLRQILRDHPEPLYVDPCCHLNAAGYAIMAREMAARIRVWLDLEAAPVDHLEVAPAELVIDDPRQAKQLRVTARLHDGRTTDVTGSWSGTRFVIDDPDLLAVDVGGAARALRRGRTQIRAQFRGHEVVVPVAAEWPPRLDGNDGQPDRTGMTPRLSFAETPAKPESLKLLCYGKPVDAVGLFVVSMRPLPAALVEPRPLGILYHGVLSAADGVLSSFEVPIASTPVARDVPQFVRVVFIGADGKLAAASNSVVVTTR
jgi:hypothetical protein